MPIMNRHHRILFITPLPPPVHGSSMVSQYIKDSSLINKQFECHYVNLSTSRRMEEIGKHSYLLYFKKAFRFIASFGLLFKNLLCNRYDLCYLAITCHGVGFLKDMPFVLLCKMFRRKVVIHQHNKGMSHDVDCWPYRWLMPLTYRGTTVILLSWHLYPDIERVVSRSQVMICPNGIPNIDGEAPSAARDNAVPHILFLSNLIVSKGVYVLLDALKILKDKGYNFVCDFVGGETKEINASIFAREVEKRQLNEIAIYHGRKYGNDKEVFFNKADIFTQPTYDDCFPLTLLEAMQHKLPIVSTEVGAVPDEIDDGITGMIAKSRDAVDLAEKLEQLLSDAPLRQKMGEAGYEKYHKEFTLEAFEKKMAECLKAAIINN